MSIIGLLQTDNNDDDALMDDYCSHDAHCLLTHQIVCVSGSAAAVDELGAMDVCARELHTRGAHAREREAHALVDVVN